jgi:hypothetical protein
MARSHRLNRRWCPTHQMYYAAWADAKRTTIARCPECTADDARYAAAVKRRAEKEQPQAEGDA